MTTTLTHYYFFPSPGFEPGYFFKRAGLHALCHSHWQVHGVLVYSICEYCTIQRYSVLWCSKPLVYLIITFCQYPVLNRGNYVKGQALYPLGHFHWRLDGVFGIFYFWVLTFRYNKGTPITRHRFKSTINKWQGTATYINILPTMSDVNLNLKLKPKPGIWLYTCAWHWP